MFQDFETEFLNFLEVSHAEVSEKSEGRKTAGRRCEDPGAGCK
jgi:hypothetical protein